jgi:dienelactone hydrolase
MLIMIVGMPVFAAKKSKSKKPKEIEPTRIEYSAKDHFHIVADLYVPPKLPKNVKVPLVIFLHEISQSKTVWKPYAKELAEKGYSVLAIDIRGHGESVINKKKQRSYWRKFKEEDWKEVSSDVTKGIAYLKENNPEVDTNRIIIIGSSMGTCVAVKAANEEKKHVKGLILLSPYSNYKGIEARVPLVDYGANPILIIVSKNDYSSYDAATELIKYSQGTHQLVLVKSAGHGTFMLKFEPKLKQIMYDWLIEKLPPEEIKVAETSKKSKKKSGKKH